MTVDDAQQAGIHAAKQDKQRSVPVEYMEYNLAWLAGYDKQKH